MTTFLIITILFLILFLSPISFNSYFWKKRKAMRLYRKIKSAKKMNGKLISKIVSYNALVSSIEFFDEGYFCGEDRPSFINIEKNN